MTYAVIFVLLLFPRLPSEWQTALISVQIAVTLMAFALYAAYYRRVWKRMKKA